MEFLLLADLLDADAPLHPVDAGLLREAAGEPLPGAAEHELHVAGFCPGAVEAAVGEKDHDPPGQDGRAHGQGQGDALVLAGGEAAAKDAQDQAQPGHDGHGPADPAFFGLGSGQFFRFIQNLQFPTCSYSTFVNP